MPNRPTTYDYHCCPYVTHMPICHCQSVTIVATDVAGSWPAPDWSTSPAANSPSPQWRVLPYGGSPSAVWNGGIPRIKKTCSNIMELWNMKMIWRWYEDDNEYWLVLMSHIDHEWPVGSGSTSTNHCGTMELMSHPLGARLTNQASKWHLGKDRRCSLM